MQKTNLQCHCYKAAEGLQSVCARVCERARALSPSHHRTWPERPARRRSSGARAATPAGSRGC